MELKLKQTGFSAVMIIAVAVIIMLLGFIAFKLYIEPSRIPSDKKAPQQNVVNRDSFSNRTPEPYQSSESAPSSSSALANPASENCVKQGGILSIKKNGAGAEFGLCQFEDDQACEEWALMRGQCPIGGVKTIGYDNDQQSYCAWIGGKTEAVENAQCTLPGGKICSDDALWNGTCG